MIDIKVLNEYSRFINLKQVCFLSDLSYENIKAKIRRFRHNQNTALSEKQSLQLINGFRKLGIKEIKTTIQK